MLPALSATALACSSIACSVPLRASVQQADREKQPGKPGAVAGENIREVVNAEVEAAETDRRHEEGQTAKAGNPAPD
jgi:hypothetical protein